MHQVKMKALSGLPVLVLLVLTRILYVVESFGHSATDSAVPGSTCTSLLYRFALYHHHGLAPIFGGRLIFKHSGTFSLLASLLLSPNPGSVCYPCGSCKKKVASNHRGLLCDLCDNWFHIKCVSVSVESYEKFCAETEFSWQCPKCVLSHLPFANTGDSDMLESDLTISSSTQVSG